MITVRDIMRSRERIARHVLRTPEIQSDFLSDVTGATVYLKLENLQRLNSFKIRGMMNKALSLTPDERSRGLLAVSSGNHGAAVSYCAKTLGIEADVYLPEGTPNAKVEKIRRYGANLHFAGRTYDEAHAIAKDHLKGARRVFADPASDELAVAGHGTIGLEMLEDASALDVVLVPVGGGGLITGIGLAVKAIRPGIRVIGVQTEACPAMVAALRDKKFYEDYPSGPSICDAVVGGIGEIGFTYAAKCVDKVVTASEDSVKEAMVELVRRDKVVAEPSGALGVAHLLEDAGSYRGMKVGVVISGGNVDFDLFRSIIAAYSEKGAEARQKLGQPPI